MIASNFVLSDSILYQEHLILYFGKFGKGLGLAMMVFCISLYHSDNSLKKNYICFSFCAIWYHDLSCRCRLFSKTHFSKKTLCPIHNELVWLKTAVALFLNWDFCGCFRNWISHFTAMAFHRFRNLLIQDLLKTTDFPRTLLLSFFYRGHVFPSWYLKYTLKLFMKPSGGYKVFLGHYRFKVGLNLV